MVLWYCIGTLYNVTSVVFVPKTESEQNKRTRRVNRKKGRVDVRRSTSGRARTARSRCVCHSFSCLVNINSLKVRIVQHTTTPKMCGSAWTSCLDLSVYSLCSHVSSMDTML